MSLLLHPVRVGLSGLLLLGLAMPVAAHNVEIAEDVAATLHIEPDDRPRAGENSLVWFALTRSGGQLIPLSQCNCNLKIYSEPARSGNQPLLQPPLTAVAAERYQGIPGATVVFPAAGRYRLEFSGRPKTTDAFQPFTLTYEITVSRGKAAASPVAKPTVQPSAQPPSSPALPENQQNLLSPLLVGTGIVLSLAAIGWGIGRSRRK